VKTQEKSKGKYGNAKRLASIGEFQAATSIINS